MNFSASFIPSNNIPWQPGLEFHNWFRGFDFYDPQNIRFAQATNDKGEAICYVRFVRCNDAYIITDFSVVKSASEADAKRAFDEIELLFEKQGRVEGFTKLLLIKPGTNECEEVRTFSHFQNVSRLEYPHRAYLN